MSYCNWRVSNIGLSSRRIRAVHVILFTRSFRYRLQASGVVERHSFDLESLHKREACAIETQYLKPVASQSNAHRAVATPRVPVRRTIPRLSTRKAFSEILFRKAVPMSYY
jgi:hypothetical protein